MTEWEINRRVALLVRLAGRISTRRRPKIIGDGALRYVVGHPLTCPFRFSFEVRTSGLLTLVVFDAEGNRLLPVPESKSIGFDPSQVDQLAEIMLLCASINRGWEKLGVSEERLPE